jgi:hypothetical protein
VTSFIPTGHPDFIQTSGTPIPVLTEKVTGLGVGTWSISDISVSSGGAYALTLFSSAFGDIACTDITVQHIDLSGTVVYTDFFGGVLASIDATVPFPLKMPGPTMVRGNIYGNLLRITGQVANSAFLNGLPGIGGNTACSLNMNIYVLPAGLGDPDPRMSNGTGLVAAGINLPGAALMTLVAFGQIPGSVNFVPCVPYTGPSVFQFRQSGVTTTPTNARLVLEGFTVAGGAAAPVWQQNYATTAALVGNNVDVDVPACLLFVSLVNNDGVQGCTWNINLTASRTA